MGIWSTQTKVEGIVLKAAWHWGSNSSIVNGPIGEKGRTRCYVGLPSSWALWTVTICFPPVSWRSLLLRTQGDTKERINLWFWKRSIFLHSGPVGGPGRRSCFTRDFKRKVRFCFIRRPYLLGTPRDELKKAVATGSPLHSGPVGEQGGGLVLTGNSGDI
jgi:hypothetical protein